MDVVGTFRPGATKPRADHGQASERAMRRVESSVSSRRRASLSLLLAAALLASCGGGKAGGGGTGSPAGTGTGTGTGTSTGTGTGTGTSSGTGTGNGGATAQDFTPLSWSQTDPTTQYTLADGTLVTQIGGRARDRPPRGPPTPG